MKKSVGIILLVLAILCFLVMFVGFYLMIQNIMRAPDNHITTLMWMGVFLGGFVGLGVIILVIFINKRKINK